MATKKSASPKTKAEPRVVPAESSIPPASEPALTTAGQERVTQERLTTGGSDRTAMSSDALERSFLDHLLYTLSKDSHSARRQDLYQALAHAVRDRLTQRWIRTQQRYHQADPKRVYYLSLEFLMGRALGNNLINVGLHETAKSTLAKMGLELSDLLEEEPDAGLGNGGLGRLAACYLDSMATLGIPGMGYGIRYEFGIFEQRIEDGQQVERPEQWLRNGNPWEFARPEYAMRVKFGGKCVAKHDALGRLRIDWVDTQDVLGLPYDTPVAGFENETVNTLRLWQAKSTNDFDLALFNAGDYLRAVQEKSVTENISKVLYPNDAYADGRELRLKQQYFFVSCSIQDIVRRYLDTHSDFSKFADKVAIQLNDTHPSIAIPELLRLFLDVHGMGWDEAWDIVTKTFGYTNHTLLSEALETWPVALMEKLLPRHVQLVYEINSRFLSTLKGTKFDDDVSKRRLSLIAEGPEKRIRMAHLATVGSHTVNGVAELHSALIKKNLLPDFDALNPGKIVNKTNGVTPRRWLLQANPALAALITESIGHKWVADLDELRRLEPFAEDAEFRKRFRAIKRANKVALTTRLNRELNLAFEPDSLFDVQIKRIHEYKRQLLDVLHAIALYQRLQREPDSVKIARTIFIAGKSAPGYYVAKQIIRLANSVAAVVNADPKTNGKLRMAFLPNYRVSLAERVIPASDLSEQISTAGKEASGTGNMKFALNGALTIGTLDGANIEIREEVGAENFFLFGLTADQVEQKKKDGYDPWVPYRENATLRAVIDDIARGRFSGGDASVFQPVLDTLLRKGDEYLVLQDFGDFLRAQREVEAAYQDTEGWTKKAILNVARMGKFSSDRAIREYAEQIWHAAPVPVGRG